MKKFFAAVAAFILAGAALAHGSSQSLTPATAAISTSQVSSYAGNGGGLSISGAANQQSATTSGTTTGLGVGIGPLKAASVGITGNAATSGGAIAGNLSVGNASGSAQASGVSTASIVGTGEAHTVAGGPQANVTGNAEAIVGTSAASGTNGLAMTGGSAVSGFDAGASASQIKVGPFQQTDVASHGITSALTLPAAQVTLGTGTVQLQTEAAANAFGQAKVGSITSTSN